MPITACEFKIIKSNIIALMDLIAHEIVKGKTINLEDYCKKNWEKMNTEIGYATLSYDEYFSIIIKSLEKVKNNLRS